MRDFSSLVRPNSIRLCVRYGFVTALYFCFAYPVLVTASSPPDNLAIDAVADGVFLHQGRHAGIESPHRGDSANIGFIVGGRCVAVIDSGGSIATGRRLREAISLVTDLPVCYVINTHVHFDHVLGNVAFAEDKPEYVGHVNLAEAMTANQSFFSEEFPQELDNLGPQSVVVPTKIVEDRLELDLGERVITLVAHPPAHTSADLTVLDNKTGTLWAGDLIFAERLPVLDASLKGWLSWIDEQSSNVDAYRYVIPGHGPVANNWSSAIAPLRSYLSNLQKETREAIQDGKFLEDALTTVGQQEAAKWQLNDRHPRNVSRAYRELEWE